MVVVSVCMSQMSVSLSQRFLCLPVFIVHGLLGDTSQISKKRATFPSPLTCPGCLRLCFQLLCLPFVYGDTSSPQGAGPETTAHFTAGKQKVTRREDLPRARPGGGQGTGARLSPSPAQVTSR